MTEGSPVMTLNKSISSDQSGRKWSRSSEERYFQGNLTSPKYHSLSEPASLNQPYITQLRAALISLTLWTMPLSSRIRYRDLNLYYLAFYLHLTTSICFLNRLIQSSGRLCKRGLLTALKSMLNKSHIILPFRIFLSLGLDSLIDTQVIMILMLILV